jgi:tetratricopeptide (TPR) repeat protein
MKAFILRIGVLSLFLVSICNFSNAQQIYSNPKYGKDSASRMECAKNISLYTEFYRQGNFKDAVRDWRKVYNDCPEASMNTFIKGIIIYKELEKLAKDQATKQKLVDTLMMIHDKRIEIFGREGMGLAFKGVDLYSYRGKDAAGEVYKMLKRSCELEKQESRAAVISIFMQSAVDEFKASNLSADLVIEAYELCVTTLDLALAANKIDAASADPRKSEMSKKEIENIATAYENVEALFSESGAATCEKLVAIFTPKYDANKTNIDWLKKVTKLMGKIKCTTEVLFEKASEDLYTIEPSSEAAFNIARLFVGKQQLAKACDYYEKAATSQTDSLTKAAYYLEWSQITLAMENFPKVRELANQALRYNPKEGKAYIVIGRAYAADAQNIGKEKIEHNTAYWPAVDKFVQAKKIDPSVETEANELISTYSKYFPNKEEAFMFGIKEGETYTVGGWINERTIARF